MSDFSNSSNMSLPIPTVGVAPGPEWATLIDSCLTTLDGHSHVPGSGVAITPSAININADLPLSSNNLTSARSVRFVPQSLVLSAGADLGCLYEVGLDLYYNDGNGTPIRITQSGSVAGSTGTITGLPSGSASASFVAISGTYVWQSATNIAADMDFASAKLRNSSPNSTYALTLSPPAGLAANYALTLPALPGSTRVLSLSTSGAIVAGVTGIIVAADIGAQQVMNAAIQDQAVSQQKLQPRNVGTGVGLGGVAVSVTSGTFTTSSTSFVTVGVPVSIVTSGRPVTLRLSAAGANLNSCVSGQALNPSPPNFVVKFINTATGTFIDESRASLRASPASGPVLELSLPPSAFSALDFCPAGTQTYDLQVRCENGGYAVTVIEVKLIAYET